MMVDPASPDDAPAEDASTAQSDADASMGPAPKTDSRPPIKDAGPAEGGGQIGDGGLNVCPSVP
jgi:hypothetical protein